MPDDEALDIFSATDRKADLALQIIEEILRNENAVHRAAEGDAITESSGSTTSSNKGSHTSVSESADNYVSSDKGGSLSLGRNKDHKETCSQTTQGTLTTGIASWKDSVVVKRLVEKRRSPQMRLRPSELDLFHTVVSK